uniref:IRG-type G domain-containing protein n=1 Tax=Astyanax mexicanus TaxID=7994 RepID=A0A3B1KFD0_ASTMX
QDIIQINDATLKRNLKIAVHRGKSTFIKAFRGLKKGEKGAAKTGGTETTTESTHYEHPTMSNMKLWDLPGIGSPNFKSKTYSKYDFFLIISSERFTDNDLMLAKEILKKEKAKKIKRKLSEIRSDCKKNLQKLGNPPVFLISSRDLSAFDFEELVSTLNSELPEHKQYALLQSVPITSVTMLEKKVDMFKKLIWAAAIASGGIATAPVPGLTFACDLNKPELKNLEKAPLLKELAASAGEFLCSLVPGLGSAVAATTSLTITHDVLENGLKVLADEARKVLTVAGLEKGTQ